MSTTPHVSCLYDGYVRHRRFAPVGHQFRYRMFQMFLDLDELPALFRGRWLWSAGRPNVAWFRRADHFGDPSRGLRDEVLDRVRRHTGQRPDGPVRVLTHLRYFGYVINPVSFYWAYDRSGDLQAIVAEVHNTPWGERHAYVLDARGASSGADGSLRFETPKTIHVSPFMGMDVTYSFRIGVPGDVLTVHIENDRGGERFFDATLHMRRRAISGASLAGALTRHPFQTAHVAMAIYWQALRLFLKRVPFHPHPESGT